MKCLKTPKQQTDSVSEVFPEAKAPTGMQNITSSRVEIKHGNFKGMKYKIPKLRLRPLKQLQHKTASTYKYSIYGVMFKKQHA